MRSVADDCYPLSPLTLHSPLTNRHSSFDRNLLYTHFAMCRVKHSLSLVSIILCTLCKDFPLTILSPLSPWADITIFVTRLSAIDCDVLNYAVSPSPVHHDMTNCFWTNSDGKAHHGCGPRKAILGGLVRHARMAYQHGGRPLRPPLPSSELRRLQTLQSWKRHSGPTRRFYRHQQQRT